MSCWLKTNLPLLYYIKFPKTKQFTLANIYHLIIKWYSEDQSKSDFLSFEFFLISLLLFSSRKSHWIFLSGTFLNLSEQTAELFILFASFFIIIICNCFRLFDIFLLKHNYSTSRKMVNFSDFSVQNHFWKTTQPLMEILME